MRFAPFLVAVAVAVATAGCGAGTARVVTDSGATPSPAAAAELACGPSRLSSEDIPTERGAEDRPDDASAALRHAIAGGTPDLAGKRGWLELTRTDDRAHFVWGDAPAYAWDAVVEHGQQGWTITGWGAGCTLRRVVDDEELLEFSIEKVSRDGRTLTLRTLVGVCGTPEPKDRLDPRVMADDDRVEISLAMRPADPEPSPPPGVVAGCPAMGLSATVEAALDQPLGDRAVHDMSVFPYRVALGSSGSHAGSWPDPRVGPAVSCVSEYPDRLAENEHAFDATVTGVHVGPRDEDAAASPATLTLDLHEVFTGPDRPSETMRTWDFMLPEEPQDAVGVRLLVAAGETLDLKGCGYTRPYSAADAEQWREAFGR
ncbi:MAG TPA: hypothetical protein VNA12_02205 [Mycobacteriales bacterium]|nr:hypothetical protein [Mycobacteriales bacterium]